MLPNFASSTNGMLENFYDPDHSIRQQAWEIKTLGDAWQHVPPWLFGYNPYVHWISTGPVFPGSVAWFPDGP
jgi:hypothetical protein